jgi:hypothetical protein
MGDPRASREISLRSVAAVVHLLVENPSDQLSRRETGARKCVGFAECEYAGRPNRVIHVSAKAALEFSTAPLENRVGLLVANEREAV